jgi:choline-sulfatase
MPQDRPNVLVLTSDQHNYRFLGHVEASNGGEPVRTPTLDALAASGTTFDSAYCPVPVCAPSRISTLTGREPRRCGAWTNGSVLRPGLATLPGVFADAGYRTCLVGKMHFGGSRQYCGFQRRPFGDLTGKAGHQHPPFPGSDGFRRGLRDAGVPGIPESLLQEYTVHRETVSFLREHRHRNPDQPWFCCASFSRPHSPFTAPRRHYERYLGDTPLPDVGREGDTADHPFTVRSYEGQQSTYEVDLDEEALRFARAGYFACVDFLDEVVGDLLTDLEADGFLDDTVVVYLSDHGEFAGEHGLWFKSHWGEDASRVPLVVETPAQRRGGADAHTVETPVSLVDLFPTLCGLADVPVPGGLDGADLSSAARTGAEPDRGPVTSDNFVRMDEGLAYRMVRDGRYKYVGFADAPELLFDLAADPRELTNLAADPAGEDAAALDRLRGYVEETIDFDTLDERRERDREVADRHELDAPEGTQRTNAYLFPDGRVVDAQTPIYEPSVLSEDPAATFDDFPGLPDEELSER